MGKAEKKMMERDTVSQPRLESVIEINESSSERSDDTKSALEEAEDFLAQHEWAESISARYLGAAIDGVIHIFLFRIIPAQPDVDEWVWVIVGDVPAAYITCDDAPDPYGALDGYLGAMEDWVRAARSGESVTDLIPVNVSATPQNADLLEKRLEFLDEHILPTLK